MESVDIDVDVHKPPITCVAMQEQQTLAEIVKLMLDIQICAGVRQKLRQCSRLDCSKGSVWHSLSLIYYT
jgi:hypothetical protein